jgi:HlyD family secretion protein
MRCKVWYILVVTIFIFGMPSLSGCSALNGATPTPLPTIVLDVNSTTQQTSSTRAASGGGVTASGVVTPAQQAQLSATLAGGIEAVTVAVGDTVQAGQVLVRLGGGKRLAAVLESAGFELLAAQQDLQKLKDGASQARATALLRVANAQKALDEAQKRRNWRNFRTGSQSSIEAAQADLILANDSLKKAEDYYAEFQNRAEDDVNRAAALSALSAARKARDRAIANLDYLSGMPNALEVNLAEAELQAAQAELDTAQYEYNSLKDGPDPLALALAQERIKNAQAQLDASQEALVELEVKAPFDGTVAELSIHSGEWITPGQPLMVLADLIHLRVETTDLSERDIPRVNIGQGVTVFVKALNLEVSGKVSEIAPLADTLGGDVVYKTTILLDSAPEGLRAGMSVEVRFDAGD